MADRTLKRAVFADLELTCWEGEPPVGEACEIIQIGVAEIDLCDLELRRTFSRIVRPTESRISEFCERLTGITPAIAKSGRPFAEVARSLCREFGATPWYAWGDDQSALAAAARRHDCEMPLSGTQLNLSGVFHQLFGLRRKYALDEALTHLGLAFEGRQHDALDDAINTARLFGALARRLRPPVLPT